MDGHDALRDLAPTAYLVDRESCKAAGRYRKLKDECTVNSYAVNQQGWVVCLIGRKILKMDNSNIILRHHPSFCEKYPLGEMPEKRQWLLDKYVLHVGLVNI